MSWAEGDEAIVAALARYHRLPTSCLERLLGRSGHLIRRRFRAYLGRSKILIQLQGGRTEEAAYALGDAGRALVADQRGIDVADLPFAPAGAEKGIFWAHHRLTCETLITFELACRDAADDTRPDSPLICLNVIGEWTLQNPREVRAKHERHLIYEQFSGGVTCRPDGAVLLSPRADRRLIVAAFLECDRGSEPMARIGGKIEGYFRRWLRYFGSSASESFMNAGAMRVLFVLGNVRQELAPGRMPQRVVSMIRELRAFAGAHDKSDVAQRFARCFLFALASQVNERSVLSEPVWWNAQGQKTALYRSPASVRMPETRKDGVCRELTITP